jgi:hypothetical protein
MRLAQLRLKWQNSANLKNYKLKPPLNRGGAALLDVAQTVREG